MRAKLSVVCWFMFSPEHVARTDEISAPDLQFAGAIDEWELQGTVLSIEDEAIVVALPRITKSDTEVILGRHQKFTQQLRLDTE